MKKSYFALYLLMALAQPASAESLDLFFQEQSPSENSSVENSSLEKEETIPPIAEETSVIKPQVLYLDDSSAPKKPEDDVVKTTQPEKSPTLADEKPAVLNQPLAPTTADQGPSKIKKEPLPKTIATPIAPIKAPLEPQDKKSIVVQRKKTTTVPMATSNQSTESDETLAAYHKKNKDQYAPFMSQASRQQAAHSLTTQAKNEGKRYPSGLDPFVIEFDQTFATLSPNAAILDSYKTAPLEPLSEKIISAAKTEHTIVKQEPIASIMAPQIPSDVPSLSEESTSNTLVLDDALPTPVSKAAPKTIPSKTSTLATLILPEQNQSLDAHSRNLLDQIAEAYHEGSLPYVHVTGYVNTRPDNHDEVRTYSELQDIGRQGASLIVDYLKQKQVPESAIAYRIIPTSTIVLKNPFYSSSLASENTLRLDIAGGRS